MWEESYSVPTTCFSGPEYPPKAADVCRTGQNHTGYLFTVFFFLESLGL